MASPRFDDGLAELRERCGMSNPEKGTISCRKCDEKFESPDRINIRICNACKAGNAWQGSREADSLYPAVRTPPEQLMEVGKKRPRAIVGRGRIIQSAMKKRSRTKEQSAFANAPLSKKRTRI